jgi:hypothetical protein
MYGKLEISLIFLLEKAGSQPTITERCQSNLTLLFDSPSSQRRSVHVAAAIMLSTLITALFFVKKKGNIVALCMKVAWIPTRRLWVLDAPPTKTTKSSAKLLCLFVPVVSNHPKHAAVVLVAASAARAPHPSRSTISTLRNVCVHATELCALRSVAAVVRRAPNALRWTVLSRYTQSLLPRKRWNALNKKVPSVICKSKRQC